LGNNSFLIKGWALTLAAGFLALSSSRMSWEVPASGLVPLLRERTARSPEASEPRNSPTSRSTATSWSDIR
jgi:hypothetical protein